MDDEQQNLIPIGAKVELRPGCEEVYRRALAGTRGVIKDRERDDYGFEKVYVAWDRDHWRDNDEPDCWTFANHFDVLELPTAQEADDPIAKLIEEATASRNCPECGGAHDEEVLERYIEAISEAFDLAADSDGFFMITIQRVPHPLNPEAIILQPQIVSAVTTEEGAEVLDQTLTMMHQLALHQTKMRQQRLGE